jgi:hypothetical protein
MQDDSKIAQSHKDIDLMIQHLLSSKLLSEDDVHFLCDKAKDILIQETNVQPVNIPITIVGDIHGQFNDFKELFSIAGSMNRRQCFLFHVKLRIFLLFINQMFLKQIFYFLVIMSIEGFVP